MNTRLLQIIQYKTDGKQKTFGEMFGWSAPYLTKLIQGKNFGLQPVIAILERFPDIDARWFILGQGTMLNNDKRQELRIRIQNVVNEYFELEQYIPFMRADELQQLELCMKNAKAPKFDEETVNTWRTKQEEHKKQIEHLFNYIK